MIRPRCEHHGVDLDGEPMLVWNELDGWDIDLSRMYCPALSEEHDDERALEECANSWSTHIVI